MRTREVVGALLVVLVVLGIVGLAVLGLDALHVPAPPVVCGPGTHRQVVYGPHGDLPDLCLPGPPSTFSDG